MPKVVVETTGNFQLLTQRKGEVIHAFRPSVVHQCHTVGFHASRGDLKVHGLVADSADDKELAEFLGKKGTVAEYMELHPVEAKEDKPAKKAAAKPAE